MLFGKDPTRQMEVFNDADGSLINIYRCIKYHPEAVAAELALLPDSREVFFDSAAQTDCRGPDRHPARGAQSLPNQDELWLRPPYFCDCA